MVYWLGTSRLDLFMQHSRPEILKDIAHWEQLDPVPKCKEINHRKWESAETISNGLGPSGA